MSLSFLFFLSISPHVIFADHESSTKLKGDSNELTVSTEIVGDVQKARNVNHHRKVHYEMSVTSKNDAPVRDLILSNPLPKGDAFLNFQSFTLTNDSTNIPLIIGAWSDEGKIASNLRKGVLIEYSNDDGKTFNYKPDPLIKFHDGKVDPKITNFRIRFLDEIIINKKMKMHYSLIAPDSLSHFKSKYFYNELPERAE